MCILGTLLNYDPYTKRSNGFSHRGSVCPAQRSLQINEGSQQTGLGN